MAHKKRWYEKSTEAEDVVPQIIELPDIFIKEPETNITGLIEFPEEQPW